MTNAFFISRKDIQLPQISCRWLTLPRVSPEEKVRTLLQTGGSNELSRLVVLEALHEAREVRDESRGDKI